jgi:uncharacterized protein YggE
MNNNRIIRVQGRSKSAQAPDRITFTFEILQIQKGFSAAVDGCNTRTESIRNAVASVGLDPKDLKTSSFQVDHAHEYVDDKKVHIGYEATHRMTITLDFDKDLVSHLLNSINLGGNKPKLSTSFNIWDPEELRCRVLEKAVRNATRRAQAIAKSANLRLGPIQLMEHDAIGIPSSTTYYREEQNYFEMKGNSSPESRWTIEPQDLIAEAAVLVVWELIV